MKPKELRQLTDMELQEQLKALKEQLFQLRFQLATSQLENPMRVRQVKHDIARVHTIIHERQLQQNVK